MQAGQGRATRQDPTRPRAPRPGQGALRVASVLALAPSPRQGRARAALGRRHRLPPIHRCRTQRSKADPHGPRCTASHERRVNRVRLKGRRRDGFRIRTPPARPARSGSASAGPCFRRPAPGARAGCACVAVRDGSARPDRRRRVAARKAASTRFVPGSPAPSAAPAGSLAADGVRFVRGSPPRHARGRAVVQNAAVRCPGRRRAG